MKRHEPSGWFQSERMRLFVSPVLAGCCIFLAFERTNLFFLLLLLPFFLTGMRQLSLKKKLLAYWMMAITTNLGGFGWIRLVAVDYGGLPQVAALGVVLLFALFNNLNFVLWAYLERFFGERCNPFVVAGLFCVSEQINPQVFPWYLGTALDSVLVLYQTADLWGVIGSSFVAMTLIHLPWWLWQKRKTVLRQERALLAGLSTFVIFVVWYGVWSLNKYDNLPDPGEKSVGISLIQSNTTMEKFYGASLTSEERMKEFHDILHLSETAIARHPDGTELVVWPEGAVHFPILNYSDIFNPISELAKKHQVSISAGSVEIGGRKPSGRREYFNTQFVLSKEGKIISKYHKIVLLAFGEYIPLLDTFPFLEQWLPETISHFTRGTEKPIVELRPDLHWLPLICYEDIIFGFIDGFDHRRADFIVNITNDGWFGKSDASYLHMQMARPRTVEYRKPIVRALNTGSSQIIDAAGRTISKETALYRREYINATLHLPQTPPVTVYSVVGNWPIYALLVLVAVLWGAKLRRKTADGKRQT
ncbi:MAG: apolipoprotein N-acyltransferase [bacterium]